MKLLCINENNEDNGDTEDRLGHNYRDVENSPFISSFIYFLKVKIKTDYWKRYEVEFARRAQG